MADKNFIVKNGLEVGGQEVVSSSGVVTSAALGGQTLASTDSPTFNNLTLTNDIAVGGDLNLTGDLNITGDVNSLSVTDLDVTDQTITLGAGQVESASGGSGIVVDGSGASILWDETNDEWDFNKSINVTGTVTADSLTTNEDQSGLMTLGRFSSGFAYSLIRPSTNATGLEIRTHAGNATARFLNSGVAELYNNSSKKLETTSTGIDVTGTATMDGLTVDSTSVTAATLNTNVNGSQITINDGTSSTVPWSVGIKNDGSNDFLIYNAGAENIELYTSDRIRQKIGSNGDISFYEDTGTTAKLFWDASTERLGIGTTSPAVKLAVSNNGAEGIELIPSGGGEPIIQSYNRSGAAFTSLRVTASDLKFYAGSSPTERMRITSSGNILIGGFTGTESGGSGSRWINLDTPSSNSYSSGLLYKINGAIKAYHYVENDMIMHQTTSGVGQYFYAGTAVAMKLDSSGNVGIGTGTSSLSRQLQLYKSSNSAYSSSSMETTNLQLYIRNADTTVNNHVGLQFAVGNNSDAAIAGVRTSDANAALTFGTRGTGSGNIIERMRISSDGDVRINTTGQMGNATLTVKAYTNTNTGLMLQEYDTSNAYGLYTVTSDDSFRITRFVSGAYSDRLIIDSNGSFGINTSSLSTEASLFIGKQPSAGNQEGGQLVLQSSVNGSKAIHIDNYNNASTDFCRFMRGTDTTSEAVLGVWDITNTRFGIGTSTPLQTLTVAGSAWATGYYITALQGNSQLTNASTSSGSNPSYIGQGLISVTISDAKAKENFSSVETNECLNKIVSLSEHVKKFDWIDEDWKREKGRTVGIVAQEIYEDHSEFVHKPENYDDDGWAIRYQEIVPTLIKAIQEQQTIIENLQSRLDEAGL